MTKNLDIITCFYLYNYYTIFYIFLFIINNCLFKKYAQQSLRFHIIHAHTCYKADKKTYISILCFVFNLMLKCNNNNINAYVN